MSNPRLGEGEVKKPRRVGIPADQDSVWEDGSGDEARSRRRDDVKGAIRVTKDGTPVSSPSESGDRRGSRAPITRKTGTAATRRKRKAARRLK
jgi:hypothetical protein